MLVMSSIILNYLAGDSQHRRQKDRPADATDGLRILARMIARAYLRDSQLKGKKSNKHGERKIK